MIKPTSYAPSNQKYADIGARLDLVNRFNFIVGVPDKGVSSIQRYFISGDMTSDNMQALIRLYEYTIDVVEGAKRP
jgi:hypothetical protein